MFTRASQNNQPTQTATPEQPQQGFRFAPMKMRFSLSKLPLVAQISGVLSLLLLGAGLLTANQLTRTSQDLQSQAAVEQVTLNYESPGAATMGLNQEKTFNVVMNAPQNLNVTAAIIRMRTAHTDLIEVTNIVPVGTGLPVVLKEFEFESRNAPTTTWSATFGANPLQPLLGNKVVAAVTVTSKDKAGAAELEISSNSEVAAFGNPGTVYDGSYRSLEITVFDGPGEEPKPPTSANACVGNTAKRVVGNQKVVLQANSEVRRGDVIEYTVAVQHDRDRESITFINNLPPHLEYINETALLQYTNDSGRVISERITPVYRDTENTLSYYAPVSRDSAGEYLLIYQAKVRETATLGAFINTANITFIPTDAASTCGIGLVVTDGTGGPPPSQPPTVTPKLSVKFQIQGVLTSGVTETGELALRYPDQQDFSKKVVKRHPNTTFVSGENGIFTSEFVTLADMPHPIIGEIEVFVKTPVSLRRKLGVIGSGRFDPTTGEQTADFNREVLFVGDFDRSTIGGATQENFFRVTDVSAMLSQFKRASNPVTEQNKEYDLDKNNVINILDVSIILSNFTRASIEGERL